MTTVSHTETDRLASVPFESAAKDVLAELQKSLAGLIAALPGSIRNASALQKALGVDNKLASLTFKAANAPSPMAVGPLVPPATSMERLLSASNTRGVPVAAATRVRSAYAQFQSLVNGHAGDRARFETMVADWTPEERKRLDDSSRHAMFEALTHLQGLCVETDFLTFVFQPSSGGDRVDLMRLTGQLGLVHLRRETKVFGAFQNHGDKKTGATTLDGRPIEGPSCDILEQFSTSPPPRFTALTRGNVLLSVLEAPDIGLRTSTDIVTGQVFLASASRFAAPASEPRGRRIGGVSTIADLPTRRQVIDVLVLPGTFKSPRPRVGVYDTAVRGQVARLDDPDREIDRVGWDQPAREMGFGIQNFSLTGVPWYTDMLRHAFDRIGWDDTKFEGFRMEVDYPIRTWNILMGFDLLERPG